MPERSNSQSTSNYAASSPNGSRTGTPSSTYWQQRADYTIAATLDEGSQSVAAVCTLKYTNNSPDALASLYFNLDQNLFKPGSEGAKRTPSGARFGSSGDFPGGFEIAHVESMGQTLAMSVNDTIGRIDLPAPVAAHGGTVEIALQYSFRVPKMGSDRFGIQTTKDGPVFQIAQWFPNVCVYDDVRGWNTLPFWGQGEFYTDFGDYDVRITVPRSHVVGATGELVNSDEVLTPEQASRLSRARSSAEPVAVISADEVGASSSLPAGDSETCTWHFEASNVRSFAWASSPAFVWDACSADAGDGRAVLCQSLYPRNAADPWGPEANGGGSTRMIRDSVQTYGRRWSPYAYPQLTSVCGVVGGMEYPMLIFCDGLSGERDLWDVTTHETSHSWFPMTVNSDERRYAWMDEGLATFMNHFATIERYGSAGGPSGEPEGPRAFADAHPRPLRQAINTPSDEIDRDMLGTLAYDKPAIGLLILRDAVLGPERFDAAFKEYIRRWSFKHPQPADFFRTIEQVSGEDLSWFWPQWFDGRDVLDQAIVRVENHGDTLVVSVRERGGLRMPVRVRATCEDGGPPIDASASAREWSDAGELRVRVPVGNRRVDRVEIDPDKLLPDVEPRNNVWERN